MRRFSPWFPLFPIPIPRIPTLILRFPTSISHTLTLILRIPIFPIPAFTDSQKETIKLSLHTIILKKINCSESKRGSKSNGKENNEKLDWVWCYNIVPLTDKKLGQLLFLPLYFEMERSLNWHKTQFFVIYACAFFLKKCPKFAVVMFHSNSKLFFANFLSSFLEYLLSNVVTQV